MSDCIVLLEPEIVEGELALHVSYGNITDGCGLDNLKEDYKYRETMSVPGPKGMPIEVHFCEQSGIGPIFVMDKVVFGPVFLTQTQWTPFHCDECGRIIVSWFANMQHEWKEKYHGEWRSTDGEGNGPKPERLN